MKRILLAGAFAGVCVLAGAQTTFLGVNIYATGNNPPLDGFSPGTSSSLQLLDTGTSGDQTASDGIYSRDVILPGAAPGPDGRYNWKVASSGFTTVNSPSSGDCFTRSTAGTVKFVFDTNVKNDGFIPDVNTNGFQGIQYTIPGALLTTSTVRMTGDFLSELGGTDWDAADNHAVTNDTGTSGDLVSGDKIYSRSVTGLPVGTYHGKFTSDGNFNYAVGDTGTWNRGGDITFNVLAVSDVILFQLDTLHGGRYKITNNNPLLNPGPPFFAVTPAWDTSLSTATTQLYDDGTHGDQTAGDLVYARKFTTIASGNFGVQVKDYVGARYPDSGAGYPIDIATTGQQVLVQFDARTSIADGYSPLTRYVWTDPLSRHVTSYVQIVGELVPIGGTFYNNNETLAQLFDDGTVGHGDASAGDKIFSNKFTAFSAATNSHWKAVGIAGSWELQFGGTGEGYTRNGDNDPQPTFTAATNDVVTFVVDEITGRVASFVNTAATAPNRPASLNNAAGITAVADWTMY